jgi:lysophospholipase L1-like esterase
MIGNILSGVGGGLSRNQMSKYFANRLPAKSLVAVVGDSIAANGYATSGGNTFSLTEDGVAAFSQGLSGVDVSWNFTYAIGGTPTTTFINNSLQSALSLNAPVWIMSLGVNDILFNTGSIATCIATATANLKTIIDAATNAGSVIIVTTLPPFDIGTNVSTYPQNQSQNTCNNAVITINQFLRNYCSSVNGAYLADWWETSVNTSVAESVFKTNFNYTNESDPNAVHVHPNNRGSFVWGQKVAPILTQICTPVRLVESQNDTSQTNGTSVQYYENPMFIGTAGASTGTVGAVSGTIATGLIIKTDNAAATVVCDSTQVSNSGVGNKQKLTITIAGAPTIVAPYTVTLETSSMQLYAPDGGTYQMSLRAKIANAGSSCRGIHAFLQSASMNSQWGQTVYGGAASNYVIPDCEFLAIQTLSKTYPTTVNLKGTVKIIFPATVTNCVVEIERVGVYKLN